MNTYDHIERIVGETAAAIALFAAGYVLLMLL